MQRGHATVGVSRSRTSRAQCFVSSAPPPEQYICPTHLACASTTNTQESLQHFDLARRCNEPAHPSLCFAVLEHKEKQVSE